LAAAGASLVAAPQVAAPALEGADASIPDGRAVTVTLPELSSLAVGSALVEACQGLLTDPEVVTLLREAVAAKVRTLVGGAPGQ
jgi:hypothetical protein